MENKRDLSLDYAKGIAMLSIVIGHLYFYSNRHVGSWVFDICDTIQIPIFMYISGLLAHKSLDRYGFRKLLSHRAIRLMLPLLSFYVIKGLIDYHDFIEIPIREYKRGYWFMLVLFELMITIYLIRRIALRFNKPTYIINAIVFAIITAYIFIVPKGNMFNILFCINLYWHYYPFFMLGFYFYKLFPLMKWKYVPIYMFIYAVSLYFYHVNGIRHLNVICNISSLLFLMIIFTKGKRPLEPVFVYLGENSLQIYMLHFFILRPLCTMLPITTNLWLEFTSNVFIAIAIIAVTMAIAQVLMKSDLLSFYLFGINKRGKDSGSN